MAEIESKLHSDVDLIGSATGSKEAPTLARMRTGVATPEFPASGPRPRSETLTASTPAASRQKV